MGGEACIPMYVLIMVYVRMKATNVYNLEKSVYCSFLFCFVFESYMKVQLIILIHSFYWAKFGHIYLKSICLFLCLFP